MEESSKNFGYQYLCCRSWYNLEDICPLEDDFDPSAPPPLKIADIRTAIPKHCWVKDPWRSMSYELRYIALVALLAVGAAYFDHIGVWALYWAAQGTIFWAIFVLGHDCGHGRLMISSIL